MVTMQSQYSKLRSTAERAQWNDQVVKHFYRAVEDYDWTVVTDRWHGPETLLHRFRQWQFLRLLRNHSPLGPTLDVGCGTGLLLRHLPAGAVGIDLNPRNVRRAQQYAPTATVLQGDAESLAFADASFRMVTCTEVLEHLVFPERAVAEMHRVLMPGGILLGSVPRASILWKLRALSSTCPGEPFHHEMRRAELQTLLQPFASVRIMLAPWFMQFFFLAAKQP